MNERKTETVQEDQKKVIAVGTRLICAKCGAEFIVTRSGVGEPRCCGEPLAPKK